MTDSSLVFEYQPDRIPVGVGLGVNRFSLDLDIIDDGIRWDWESVYSGAYLYATFRF